MLLGKLSDSYRFSAFLCILCALAGPLGAQQDQANKQIADSEGYEVVHIYPHDPSAYTQGLIYLDGTLYEGTGLEGQSSIRKVQLETGEVLQSYDLPGEYFGEGITDWGSNLLELTWKSNTCFVYDRTTFRVLRTFHYDGEGWGLTHDQKHLIMSDGTAKLRILDPASFKMLKRVNVTYNGRPVENLNELEYIHGKIYANVWMSDRIAIIAPDTGKVLKWIDLSHIFPDRDSLGMNAVLNGIAYDEKNDRIFVTGKLWPKLFEIKLAH
jgi:glutamine cyclotransferase